MWKITSIVKTIFVIFLTKLLPIIYLFRNCPCNIFVFKFQTKFYFNMSISKCYLDIFDERKCNPIAFKHAFFIFLNNTNNSNLPTNNKINVTLAFFKSLWLDKIQNSFTNHNIYHILTNTIIYISCGRY